MKMHKDFLNKLNNPYWKLILFSKINSGDSLILAIFIGFVNIIFQPTLLFCHYWVFPSSAICKFDTKGGEIHLQQSVQLLSFQDTFIRLFFKTHTWLLYAITFIPSFTPFLLTMAEDHSLLLQGVSQGSLVQLLLLTFRVTEVQGREVISSKIT